MNLENKTIGFGFTAAFGLLKNTIDELKKMSKIRGVNIIPIMSYNCYNINTRFGESSFFIKEIENITQKNIISTLEMAEQSSRKNAFDIFIVAPCTGNTISKLACDIIDTPVTMAVKTHLKNEKPVVISISSNNALSGNAENIGKLLNRKNYYFVPFRQSNPITKPKALVFDSSYIIKTLEYALDNEQIQPMIL